MPFVTADGISNGICNTYGRKVANRVVYVVVAVRASKHGNSFIFVLFSVFSFFSVFLFFSIFFSF